MLRVLLVIAILAALSGCAGEQLSTPPKAEDLTTASDVYIIRKSSIVGSGLTYTIGVDHHDFVKLGSGQYVHIKADHGTHVLTVKYPKQAFVGTAEQSMEFECKHNNQVYLLIWPGLTVNMKALSMQEGAKLVKKYKQIILK